MRILFICLLIFGCTRGVSKYNQIDKNRKESFLRNDCQLIFIKKSIGANVLNSKANELLTKIQQENKLSQEEDIAVIMIMNTLDLTYSDSSDTWLRTCNFVFDLQKIFEESYLNELRTKYTICTGGSTLKFKELKMGYSGSPTSCSRFIFVSNPYEGEKTLDYYKIVPEKIRL